MVIVIIHVGNDFAPDESVRTDGVPMKLFAFLFAAALSLACAGCAPEECQLMKACCDAVKDVDGMGDACGELAQSVTKPETCTSVVQTVSYMYEDRGLELPDACKLGGGAAK
jgi:hypothetical protein